MRMGEVKRLPESELEIMQIIWASPAPVSRMYIEEALQAVHPLVQNAAHHPPGQRSPLFQMPQLRAVSAGAPGQRKDHRQLPQLRRQF